MSPHTIASVRRRVGSRLRSLRETARLSVPEAAASLGWTAGRVRQAERGVQRLTAADLHRLVALYEVTDSEVAELLAQAREADRVGWEGYRGLLSSEFVDYLTLEESASAMHQYNVSLVPGLLQTERYMREVFASFRGAADAAAIDRLVEARRRRQELLSVNPRPELRFVIDETALLRPVGGAAGMAEQLRHLRDLRRVDGVHLAVLPVEVGLHGGLRGSFNLLEFAGSRRDWVLFFEKAEGDDLDHDHHGARAASYFELFDDLETRAVAGEALDELLERSIRHWDGTANRST